MANIIANSIENDNGEDSAPEDEAPMEPQDEPTDYTDGGYVDNEEADYSALGHTKFEIEEAI